MTSQQSSSLTPADLAELADTDPRWQAWRAAHPEQTADIEDAREARAILQQLHAMAIDVPDDIEARIRSRVHRTAAVRDLLTLHLAGSTRAVLELMTLLLRLIPAMREDSPSRR